MADEHSPRPVTPDPDRDAVVTLEPSVVSAAPAATPAATPAAAETAAPASEPAISTVATAPSAEPAAPPPIADGVRRRLDPRLVPLQRLVGWIVTGSVSLGLLLAISIVMMAADLFLWVTISLALLWSGVTVGLAWLSYRWPDLVHRHASYRVDEQGIEIQRGVLWRRVINVPRSRVQHIDVTQGPLERRYGLGTLVVYTAGTDHAKVDLHGLEHETALEIRDHLLPREGDDAV